MKVEALGEQLNRHCSLARGESIHGPSAATSLWRTASNNVYSATAMGIGSRDAAAERTGMYIQRPEKRMQCLALIVGKYERRRNEH